MENTAFISDNAFKSDGASAHARLRAYVKTALFRLRLQEALRALTVVLLVSVLLLAVTIVADRACSFTRAGINVYIIWACLCVLGIPYMLWRTFTPRLHEELASVLADDRLGLNSRLSTALTLDLRDPANARFSQAFFAEADARLRNLKVAQAFPLRLSKLLPLIVLLMAACYGLYTWMPWQDSLGLLAQHAKKLQAEAVQTNMARKLDQKIQDLKKVVDSNTDDKNATYKVSQLLDKAEQISKDLKDGKRNPEEALLGLGQIKRDIQDEKEKLERGKEFLDRLEKLKAENLNLEESALTREVSKALKMGDPGQAAREMRKLAQKIQDDILNDSNKTDEQKQAAMDKLKKEIDKLSDALSEDENLRDQLRELSKEAMGASEFEGLKEEIKKQMERQGKGSKQIGENLQKQMDDIADELERLEEDNDTVLDENDENEMEQLDELEEGVDEAIENSGADEEGVECEAGAKTKEGQSGKKKSDGKPSGKKAKKSQGSGAGKQGKGRMKSGKPGGEGGQPKRKGQGGGAGQGQPDKPNGQPGGGLGEGQGHRPYQDGDATFQQEKVKGQMQSGAITGISHFRGQGAKGEAPVEFVKAFQAAEQEASSSLETERIPNDAKEVVKSYFSKVKEGSNIHSADENTKNNPTPAGTDK